MSKARKYVMGILYIVIGILLAMSLFILNERYSLFLMKLIIAVGVLVISFVAGLSIILSIKYEEY